MGEKSTSGGGSAVWIGRFAELEDALCQRVRELRYADPLAPVTIVVGSAVVRTRVGDLLVRRLDAFANVRVVTLARYASDLVATAGGAPPVRLAGLARERLLRRLVAARARAGLSYFGPVWERPHFVQALRATFDDLREALVEPGSEWASAAAAAGPGAGAAEAEALAAKCDDLRELYAAYCEELERRGVLDDAELYRLAAEAGARRVATGEGSGATLLYGIYDLNQAQEALAAALLGGADVDLFVPLPRDDRGEGAETLSVARRLGRVPRELAPPSASADVDRLAALWRVASAPEGRRLELGGDGSVAVVSVADERAEGREAVRAVVAALADGAEAWDCAVVVPRAEDVERVAVALLDAGLPVACRRPDRSVGPRVLLRLMDCLAPQAGVPFARRAVLDLLSAATLTSPVPPEYAALWADEAREAGVIGGLDQWTERLSRRRRGLEADVGRAEAGAELPRGDDEEAEKLDRLRRRRSAAQRLDAVVAALAGACTDLPERGSWGRWATVLAEVAAAVFDREAAAAAADAAGRLRALQLLDEEVDVTEVAAALREQLATATVPAGRAGRDGVALLTPLQLRGLRFDTVVFTGLAEGGFPVRARPDPLLGDAERARVASLLGVRLPLAESREVESLLLFAFVAEAARRRLVLLAPRTDAATGRPRLPSRLLLRLASLAAGRPVGLDEFLRGEHLLPVWRRVAGTGAFLTAETTAETTARAPGGAAGTATVATGTSTDTAPAVESGPAGVVWTDCRERDMAALLALSAAGARAAAGAYLGAVVGDERQAARRLGRWRAARTTTAGPWDGVLGAAAREALATRHPFHAEMPPTRLERYIDCPFAFLLRDVFGLDAPEEPAQSLEMDVREFGTLAHEILEQVFAAVIAAGPDVPPDLDAALAETAAAWERSCAAAEQRGVTGAALAWEVRRRLLFDDLRQLVALDPVFAGDGRPQGVEARFGERYGRPVVLELGGTRSDGTPGGRSVRFAGRLDRVDVTSRGARVIDYKTGKGSTEERRLKKGLSVQLPVYQLAVRQTGGEDHAEIECLYRFVTRRGDFRRLPLDESEAAAARRLRRLVAATVGLVDAGLFPRTTAGRCDFCEVRYACGVSAWTRARKRGDQGLRDVVDLQNGDLPEDDDDAG